MNKVGLFKILLFNDSRKVGVGLWLYVTSHIFFVRGMLSVDQWMACTVISVTLIGGGTIADKMIAKKKDDAIPSA